MLFNAYTSSVAVHKLLVSEITQRGYSTLVFCLGMALLFGEPNYNEEDSHKWQQQFYLY